MSYSIAAEAEFGIFGGLGKVAGILTRNAKGFSASRRFLIKGGGAAGTTKILTQAQRSAGLQAGAGLGRLRSVSKLGSTASDLADMQLNQRMTRRQFLMRAGVRATTRNPRTTAKVATAPVRSIKTVRNAIDTGNYKGYRKFQSYLDSVAFMGDCCEAAYP